MNIAFSVLSESGNVIDRLQGLGDAKSQLADKDYWSSVGIISITGILVVFLILAVLIFFFWLMGTIFKAIDKSRAAKEESAKSAIAETPAPAAESAPVEASQESDDEELVAVISAAIAAYEGDGNFMIRSIRKRGDANTRTRSAWGMAGLGGNMRQF